MKTQIPTDLTAATEEELLTAETALMAEFDATLDEEGDISALTEIADAIDAIRVENKTRAEASEKKAEQLAELAERIRPVAETEDESADADIKTEDAEEASEEINNPETDEVSTEIEESELVTASADKTTPKAPSASAVARRSQTPEVAKPSAEVVITAAADIPGYAGGANLDKVGMAKALHAKARTLSNGSGYVPVASINLPIEHKLGADMSYNLDIIDQVTNPKSLTASGWCAPSNTMYEMFGIEAADGLLDLPTVQITRGGLNVPSFIGYQEAVENGGLWTWDEADQDASDYGATKPCVYIPCPDFTDYRLVAEGICVTNGNLTDRAFPELTARYIELVVNTHLHRVNGAILNTIANQPSSSAFVPAIAGTSTAGRTLQAIDFAAQKYREDFRMSVNSVIEIILPVWAKSLLRSDLAMRSGVDLVAVSDAMMDEYFAVRKVRPQFVYDYQDIGGTAFETSWPANLKFTVYAAGAYLRGDGGVIDLGIVRDSVLNATNDYTAAWTEQMYLVAQVGPAARNFFVTIDNEGFTGCCPDPVVA